MGGIQRAINAKKATHGHEKNSEIKRSHEDTDVMVGRQRLQNSDTEQAVHFYAHTT